MTLINSNSEWNRLSAKDGYKGNWKRLFCKHKKTILVFRENDKMMEGIGYCECQTCGYTYYTF